MKSSLRLRYALHFLVIVCVLSVQGAQAEILKGKHLFSQDQLSKVDLSPNGEIIAVPFDNKSGHKLHLFSRDNSKLLTSFDLGDDSVILKMEWLNNTQLFLKMRGARSTRNFIVEFDGTHSTISIVDAQGNLVHAYPQSATELIFAKREYKPRTRRWRDILYKISIEDLKNSNFDDAHEIEYVSKDIKSFHFDESSQRFIGIEYNKENETTTIKTMPIEGGDWQEVISYKIGEDIFTPVAQLKDGSFAVLSNIETDTLALQRFDPKNKVFIETIFQHPQYDLLSAHYSRDGELSMVTYEEHGLVKREVFDPVSKTLNRRLAATFPNQEFYIADKDDDAKYLIVTVVGDTTPGEYLVYDSIDDKLHRLFSSHIELADRKYSPTLRRSLLTQDGIEIEAFLTLPHNLDYQTLLVMPHGGPIGVKESARFNREVQYFASRGLSVLRINFRGSSGFGKTFQEQGKGEFGRLIEQDISAVVEDVRRDYHFEHICAAGTSYGGYSAMMLSIKHPDIYDCVIGAFGIYDLPLLFSQDNFATTDKKREQLEKIVGKYDDSLYANSPVYLAENIKAPVLLIAGVEDEIASYEHTHRMAFVLKEKGALLQEVYYKYAGHGHSNWEGDRHQAAVSFDFIVNALALKLPDTQMLSKDSQEALADDFAIIGSFYGKDLLTQENNETMISYIEKAVAFNHADATAELAGYLINGKYKPKDIEKALQLYTEAARLGNADAMRELAYHKMRGDLLKHDWEGAQTLIINAIDSDDSILNRLSLIYLQCLAPEPVKAYDSCLEGLSFSLFGKVDTSDYDRAKFLLRPMLPHLLSAHHLSAEEFLTIKEKLVHIYEIKHETSDVSIIQKGVFERVANLGYGKGTEYQYRAEAVAQSMLSSDDFYLGLKLAFDFPGVDKRGDNMLIALEWIGEDESGLRQKVRGETFYGDSTGQWQILLNSTEMQHYRKMHLNIYSIRGELIMSSSFEQKKH